MSELKDRFADALAPEPQFQTDLSTSLDAAVRGGRRRRARAVAGKVVALAACAVVVGGVALAIRPTAAPPATVAHPGASSSSSPSQPPADCTGGCQPQDYHHGVPAVRADVPDATLDTLANAVMTEGGGQTALVSPREPSPAGDITVKTGAGTYRVTVAMWAERFDAKAWASECLPGDGKPCRVQARSDTDLAMAMRYLDGSGRAKLTYVADAGAAPDGTPITVEVTIDNLAEQAGGAKSVGPTWSQLGYTPTGIRAALAGTGLLT